MKHQYISIIAFLSFFFAMNASLAQQFQTVVFNAEKSYFGENEALPSERSFMVTGVVPAKVVLVELQVLSPGSKRGKQRPVYAGQWKRTGQNTQGMSYNIPINQYLRQNSEYDFYLSYYKKMTEEEKDSLKARLFSTVDIYFSQLYQRKGRRIRLTRNHRTVLRELNTITNRLLDDYRILTQRDFTGYSELVTMKIKDVEQGRVSRKDGDETKDERVGELQQLIKNELAPLFEEDWLSLSEDYYIDNYPTEKTKTVFGLNVGYAGIPLSYNTSNFNYTSGMYVGMSFPLGKQAFSKFLHRTAFSAGVLIPTLREQAGSQALRAPFTKIPLYLALSFRPWRFLRIHAGATVFEKPNASSPQIIGLDQAFNVRPMIGLSIELNVWADLAK